MWWDANRRVIALFTQYCEGGQQAPGKYIFAMKRSWDLAAHVHAQYCECIKDKNRPQEMVWHEMKMISYEKDRLTNRVLNSYQVTRLKADSCEPHGRSCSPTGCNQKRCFVRSNFSQVTNFYLMARQTALCQADSRRRSSCLWGKVNELKVYICQLY